MSLPTYQEAIQGPDPLTLILPFLDRGCLLTACQVNKKWYHIFAPKLWAEPIKIAMDTARPFLSTYRFIQNARTASVTASNFVRVLDFRPLLSLPQPRHSSDIIISQNIISACWALDQATMFRNLRCLILDGLVFKADESDAEPVPKSLDHEPKPLLLSTTQIPGLRSISMLRLPFLSDIVFLDLSYTPQPSDWPRQFSQLELSNLRILKLRGLRLTDQNLPSNILNTHLRLWSLDLGDNFLTDVTISLLLHDQFLPNFTQSRDPFWYHIPDQELYSSAPAYTRLPSRTPNPASSLPLRNDSKTHLTKYLKNASHHPEDDDPYFQCTGLTHLNLSNNKITSQGIIHLLSSTNRLQSLDMGSTPSPLPGTSPLPYATSYYLPIPSSSLLSPLFTHLTTLRAHHSLISLLPTILPTTTYLSTTTQTYTLPQLHHAERIFLPPIGSTPFSPFHNHAMHTLTLTLIPTLSFGPLISRLKSFLRLCSEQESILHSIPTRHRHSPPLHSGLRVLRLEFISLSPSPSDRPYGTWDNNTSSISEDRDATNFLANAAGDFSFFDGAEEQASALRKGKGVERFGQGQMSSYVVGKRGRTESGRLWGEVEELWMKGYKDVVKELKSFRNDPSEVRWGGKLEIVMPRG